MDNKLIGTIMAVVVGVITIGSLLVPVIEDTTATTGDLENDGYFHMTKYDTTEDVTIEWDHENPTVITVNGTDYSPNTPTNKWVSLAIGDDWYFRYADGSSIQYIQMTYGGIEYISASTSAATDITVVCSEGTATATIYTDGTAGTTKTAEYTELYVISGDTGDYVMKDSDESVYMASDSEFVALGSTALGSGRCVLRIDGTIEDGATVTVIGSSYDDTTTSDITVNTTDLDEYIGYSLSTITFTVNANDTDYDATYSYFIVPSEVTLELREHMGEEAINLIEVLPVLLIVGLFVVTVGAIYFRNKD